MPLTLTDTEVKGHKTRKIFVFEAPLRQDDALSIIYAVSSLPGFEDPRQNVYERNAVDVACRQVYGKLANDVSVDEFVDSYAGWQIQMTAAYGVYKKSKFEVEIFLEDGKLILAYQNGTSDDIVDDLCGMVENAVRKQLA